MDAPYAPSRYTLVRNLTSRLRELNGRSKRTDLLNFSGISGLELERWRARPGAP